MAFQTITKPGIYAGVPIDLYHHQPCDGPSISSSGLRTIMDQSLAHYWCRSSLNPDRVQEETSDAFTLGRATHHLLLGEDQFSTQFIVRPEKLGGEAWQGNRTDCKAWLKDQAAAGRTVLLPAQIEAIRGMAKSLAGHPLIKAGILNGDVERTMAWKDPVTGIWLLSRPDCIPNDSGDFSDLKTSVSVDYGDLKRTIGDYGYQQQGALVGKLYKELTGRVMTSFSLVFVEKKPPHCVRVVTLKDSDLERGRQQNEIAVRMFAEALEKNEWPGPGDYNEADFIELPEWKQKQIDRQLEYFKAPSGGQKPAYSPDAYLTAG